MKLVLTVMLLWATTSFMVALGLRFYASVRIACRRETTWFSRLVASALIAKTVERELAAWAAEDDPTAAHAQRVGRYLRAAIVSALISIPLVVVLATLNAL